MICQYFTIHNRCHEFYWWRGFVNVNIIVERGTSDSCLLLCLVHGGCLPVANNFPYVFMVFTMVLNA